LGEFAILQFSAISHKVSIIRFYGLAKMMNKRTRTRRIISVVIIAAAVSYFIYEAFQSSWAYYYSVDEFVGSDIFKASGNDETGNARALRNHIIRLAGRVQKQTIKKDSEKMQLDFKLEGEKKSVNVRFFGMVPKNFSGGKEVVVEGKIGNQSVFLATKILTRCESKYKVKLQTQQ